MIVSGQATYLKSESGRSERNGEARVWHRAAFLDDELNAVTFYFDDPKLFDGMEATTEVLLDISLNQGRSGFFANIIGVQVLK